MSEEFETAFADDTCGVVRTCKCGRTHFNDIDTQLYDDKKELEDLREKAKTFPDKYIPRDGDIYDINVFGNFFVFRCPCGGLEKAEAAIWNSRYAVLDYFRRMKLKKEQELKQLENAMEGIGS